MCENEKNFEVYFGCDTSLMNYVVTIISTSYALLCGNVG